MFLYRTSIRIQICPNNSAAEPPKALNALTAVFFQKGPVDQFGMIAAFATRKPRVQIPPGPQCGLNLLGYGYHPSILGSNP
jgi:hypothetical protein